MYVEDIERIEHLMKTEFFTSFNRFYWNMP